MTAFWSRSAPAGPGSLRASRGGLDALAEALHPLGETPHVVAGSELDRGVATGEALDPARDSPEVAEEHAPGAEAERDREGEGARAERDASQEGIAKGLPDEARRHAHLHGAEGLVPDADGEPDLVDLRRAQQHPRELREPRREHVVEERASGSVCPWRVASLCSSVRPLASTIAP